MIKYMLYLPIPFILLNIYLSSKFLNLMPSFLVVSSLILMFISTDQKRFSKALLELYLTNFVTNLFLVILFLNESFFSPKIYHLFVFLIIFNKIDLAPLSGVIISIYNQLTLGTFLTLKVLSKTVYIILF